MAPAAMNPDLAFAVWSGERQRRIEHVLVAALPAQGAAPESLGAAMRYATLEGGKRIRPLLAYAAGEAAGADPAIVDAAAAAVELVHAYSLVHDDLPCMDDDTLRRGRPTCHVAFGEATALLAGDALQALAFDVLARGGLPDAAGACALLAAAAGSGGMAGGQAIDLAAVGATLALDRTRDDAPDEDRRADPRLGSPRRRLRTRAVRERDGGPRRVCGRRRTRVPGRRRRARRRRLGGVARQDGRQGRRGRASRPTLRCWESPAPRNAPRLCASKPMRRSRPLVPGGRRLAELADWIVLRDR